MPSPSRRWLPSLRVLSVALPLVTTAALFVLATRHGIGLGNDSAQFLRPAQALLDDGSFVSLHHPPLTALLVALVAWIGRLDVVAAAWWVQLFALLGTVTGFTWILRSTFPDRPWVALVGGMVVAVSDLVVGQALVAGSEVPALAFILVAMGALARHLHGAQGGVSRWMILSVVAGALALAARYAAFPVVLTISLALWLWGRRSGPDAAGFGLAVAAGAAMVAPALAHVVANSLIHGSAANRSLGYAGPVLDRIPDALATATLVFLPERFAVWPVGLLFLILLGAAASAGRRAWSRHGSSPLLMLIGLHGALTVIFLLVTMMFVDHWTQFDQRIMLPVLVSLLLAGVIVLARGAIGGRWMAWVAVAAVALPLAAGVRRTAWMVGHCRTHGIEHRRVVLTECGLGAVVAADREAGAAVFCNNPAMLWNLTQLECEAFPARFDPISNHPNPDIETELAEARAALRAAPNALLITLPIPDNESRLSAPELLGPIPADVVMSREGVTVLRVRRE